MHDGCHSLICRNLHLKRLHRHTPNHSIGPSVCSASFKQDSYLAIDVDHSLWHFFGDALKQRLKQSIDIHLLCPDSLSTAVTPSTAEAQTLHYRYESISALLNVLTCCTRRNQLSCASRALSLSVPTAARKSNCDLGRPKRSWQFVF